MTEITKNGKDRITKKMIKDAYESEDVLTYSELSGKNWKKDLFSKVVLKVRKIKFSDENQFLPKYRILEKCYEAFGK